MLPSSCSAASLYWSASNVNNSVDTRVHQYGMVSSWITVVQNAVACAIRTALSGEEDSLTAAEEDFDW